MYRLICQKPAHFLSAKMALVSTFFQMFIVLGMYNFDIRENHDLCTLIGWGINLFYAATGTLLLFLTFSVFLATTSGIIGGYIGVYLSLGRDFVIDGRRSLIWAVRLWD